MDQPTYNACADAISDLIRECLKSDHSEGEERKHLTALLAENGNDPTSFSIKITIDPGEDEIAAAISIPRGSHKSRHTTKLPDPNQSTLPL